jgi:hypothetical protein
MLFVYVCVLYYCHQVAIQLQLTNIPYILYQKLLNFHSSYELLTFLVELLTTTMVAGGLWNCVDSVKVVSLVRCIGYIQKADRPDWHGIQHPKQSGSYNPLLSYIGSVLRPYFPLYSATPRSQLYIILEFVGRNDGILLRLNKDPCAFRSI